MNCYAAAGLIDLHQDGRLSPARAAQVAAHLASCAHCSAAYAPVTAAAKAPSAPASFKDRLRKGLTAGTPVAAAAAPRAKQPPQSVVALVSFILALGVLHALLRAMPPSQRDSSTPDFSVRRLP